MTWLLLALKNAGRRPLRTLVTTAGVAIAVAALFSLLAFQRGYRDGVERELDRLGAHVLIVPKGCPYDAASIALHGARWPCYLKGRYLEEVRSVPTVSVAAPAFMNALDGPDGGKIVYVGTGPEILALKRGWRIEGRFPSAPGELLAGADYAKRQGWTLGQQVPLPGLKGRTGTVAGLLAPTSGPDDGFLYTRLADAQAWFRHPGELTHILVRLRDPNLMDAAVRLLHSCDAGLDMNVVPLAHLFRTIRHVVNSTRLLLGCIAVIALLVAGSGVSNAVLMAVVERTREIGIMRALGASRADVFRLFWLETLLTCLAGGLVGIAGAWLGAGAIEAWVRDRLPFAPADPLIRWEGWVAGSCLVAVLLLGTAAGLLPAWRAARLAPAEAFRAAGGTA